MNNYDDAFMARFAYHYARTGSVPQCIPLLLDDFQHMEAFNKNDLNQLRIRKRRQLGVDLLQEERERHIDEISSLNTMAIDNIKNGKDAIDEGMDVLISKLQHCNTLLQEHDVGTKMFSILLMTQEKLATQISKYTGIDAAMDVKKAMALTLLKQGKPDEAQEAITGIKRVQESLIPQIMDGSYDVDDDDDETIEV
jgi:hypothetical protein